MDYSFQSLVNVSAQPTVFFINQINPLFLGAICGIMCRKIYLYYYGGGR